ncbi:MAG: hypothetical protein GF346_08295 [Candidatus Eisenbacteria bacterium]|nr:hypothetical protein [Candidatus Latescibacterota bacterium]MBD3302433.1 hypothetical protein [Candidatus Eisenbacteria bacterium]
MVPRRRDRHVRLARLDGRLPRGEGLPARDGRPAVRRVPPLGSPRGRGRRRRRERLGRLVRPRPGRALVHHRGLPLGRLRRGVRGGAAPFPDRRGLGLQPLREPLSVPGERAVDRNGRLRTTGRPGGRVGRRDPPPGTGGPTGAPVRPLRDPDRHEPPGAERSRGRLRRRRARRVGRRSGSGGAGPSVRGTAPRGSVRPASRAARGDLGSGRFAPLGGRQRAGGDPKRGRGIRLRNRGRGATDQGGRGPPGGVAVIFYLQGGYVPQEEARVSVLDRGFLFGDSIYEAIRSVDGKPVFYRDHLARLHHSAELLGFDLTGGTPDLRAIMRELLRRNGIEDSRMRIVVTRGTGGRDQISGFTPTWVVTIEPFATLPDEEYERGVAAVLVSVARTGVASLNPEIKSSNLLNNILARQEAVRKGAAEGVMLNPDGLLAEGAYSNLFWVDAAGILRTPSLEVGILPGVTRQKVIVAARAAGLAVAEDTAGPEALESAREILLTSTSWEVIPVTRWNGAVVGSGRRGEIAAMLRDRLRALYHEDEEDDA